MGKRVNRAIALLEGGQPVYYTGVGQVTYEGGKEAAQTWADVLILDMEHGPFDLGALSQFMRGLVDGGPTRSGYRTPAVIVTVPATGRTLEEVRYNAWQFQQVLDRGVHGILLCHAQSPEAVRAFVEACRYPFHRQGVGEGLGEGRRGFGGQGPAAAIWGVSVPEYLEKADPWPLNPKGELLLGLKIENRWALERAEESVRVPGIAFAEWGPGDMGMSLGFPERHDPPYPPEMQAARERVFRACRAAGIAFLEAATREEVVQKIRDGVRIIACRGGAEVAEEGRRFTGRGISQ